MMDRNSPRDSGNNGSGTVPDNRMPENVPNLVTGAGC